MKRRLVALLFAAAFCAQVGAQELDIYDLNDFVDPRQLGAVVGSHGRLNCPCDPFLVSRLVAGGAVNYLDVFRATDASASFIHVANSYYRGPWQANWKITQLNREGNEPDARSDRVRRGGSDDRAYGNSSNSSSSATPLNKNTVQLARYFAVGRQASPSIIRLEATWTSVEYRQAAPTAAGEFSFASRRENEVGFEGDIPWRVGRFPLITSLVYVGRYGRLSAAHPDSQFGHRRVTLLQRLPRLSVRNWSLDPAIALGSVDTGRWSDLMVQPSLHVTSPEIPRLNTRVHIRYAPQIGRLRPPARGETQQSEIANQFTIFIDRAIFTRRF